jgi:predicted RNA-binding Zn-ribbon protein involved in translation (DUF1610 family)
MNELLNGSANEVSVKNNDVQICISCGSLLIDSYEFGISCEDCGALIWRAENAN